MVYTVVCEMNNKITEAKRDMEGCHGSVFYPVIVSFRNKLGSEMEIVLMDEEVKCSSEV